MALPDCPAPLPVLLAQPARGNLRAFAFPIGSFKIPKWAFGSLIWADSSYAS
jgi:hypothetical protein